MNGPVAPLLVAVTVQPFVAVPAQLFADVPAQLFASVPAQLFADVPGWAIVLFALLTQLGDPWFVFVGVTLVYWLGDDRLASRPRRTGATLIALGLCALAATIAFKSGFALPRPSGAGEATPPVWLPSTFVPTFVSMATGTGFGFPSGHAIGATVVYGGAAVLCDRLRSRRRRYVAAAGLVVLISLSRLVLGVHDLGDVTAGVLTGLVVLWLALRVSRGGDQPAPAFLLAAAIAVGALAATLGAGHADETYEAALGLGSALGGVAAWKLFDVRERVRASLAVVCLAALGGLWAAVHAFEPMLPGTVLGAGVALGGIVAVPGLVARLGTDGGLDRDRERVAE